MDLVQILQRGTVALRVVKKGVSSHYSLFATLVVIPRRPSTKMKVRRLIPLQMVGYQYCILRLFDVPLQLKTAYCCAIRCIFLAIFTTLATRTSRIIQYVLYRARPFVVTTMHEPLKAHPKAVRRHRHCHLKRPIVVIARAQQPKKW